MQATSFLRGVAELQKALQKGSTLCVQFCLGGTTFWLEPDGRAIPSDVATWTLVDPGVQAVSEGLFEGFPQAWRYVSGEIGFHSRVGEAAEGARPSLEATT